MSNEENMVNEVDDIEDMDLEDMDLDITEDEDEAAESLDSLNEENEAPAEEPQPEPQGTSEPGYVQRRIEKAIARERNSIIAQVKAEMEAQYAPIRERLPEADAKEMGRRGEVKDIETAKELLRYRQGQPKAVETAPAEQPRNDRGQFAPAQQFDRATSDRIDKLSEQADAIKAMTGIDVIEAFSNDEEIKRKVVSGEMDFIELAKQLQEQQAEPQRKRPPAPTRSPNGASGLNKPNAISSMSDEQFDRLERRIKEGARFTLT